MGIVVPHRPEKRGTFVDDEVLLRAGGRSIIRLTIALEVGVMRP